MARTIHLPIFGRQFFVSVPRRRRRFSAAKAVAILGLLWSAAVFAGLATDPALRFHVLLPLTVPSLARDVHFVTPVIKIVVVGLLAGFSLEVLMNRQWARRGMILMGCMIVAWSYSFQPNSNSVAKFPDETRGGHDADAAQSSAKLLSSPILSGGQSQQVIIVGDDVCRVESNCQLDEFLVPNVATVFEFRRGYTNIFPDKLQVPNGGINELWIKQDKPPSQTVIQQSLTVFIDNWPTEQRNDEACFGGAADHRGR